MPLQRLKSDVGRLAYDQNGDVWNFVGFIGFSAHEALLFNTYTMAQRMSPLLTAVVAGEPRVRSVIRRSLAHKMFDAAAAEDRGDADIAGSVAVLFASGLLCWDAVPTDALFGSLVAVGEANLPLARLYEGHVNALYLVRTFGEPALQAEVRRDVNTNVLLGVWGADAVEPLAVDGDFLSGGKRFASGLGAVGQAVVTVGQGTSVQLALLDVSDKARHQGATWRKSGMRATASGDFDASGMPASAVRWIGAPGQYLEEPGFIGGVWRIAAVQAGGSLGLLRAAADHLAGLGRLMAEAQVARLAPVLTRALAAAEFTRRAAAFAEGPGGARDPDRAASLSAQARLLTEDVGQDAIAAVERSVGLPHFDVDGITGRIARDLATYMRQSARDPMLQRAGGWALERQGVFSQLLSEEVSDARG